MSGEWKRVGPAKPVVIARVEAGHPPAGTIKTVEDFLRWRIAEDQRMMLEFFEQSAAYYELREGATRN